jgi:hypothetical protein
LIAMAGVAFAGLVHSGQQLCSFALGAELDHGCAALSVESQLDLLGEDAHRLCLVVRL